MNTMKTEELEPLSVTAEETAFPRHSLEAPELTIEATYYPMGFPTRVRTNSARVLRQCEALWSVFAPGFDTDPIRIDVHVTPGDDPECPPAPKFQMMLPTLLNVADTGNFSVINLDRGTTQIMLVESTLQYPDYLNFFLLGSSPLSHIVTRFATPVHAACVALDGCGILLCGDSGAGKSSLSFACAQSGWTYITDDCSYLIHPHIGHNSGRTVTGNCHQVRFRPSAAELFPQLEGLPVTPRAAGKPSIELPTAPMPGIVCSQNTEVGFLVYLNRTDPGPPQLRPYSREAARHSLRKVVFGSRESLATQYAAIESLLSAEVFELRYTDLDWAVDRLATLARKGY